MSRHRIIFIVTLLLVFVAAADACTVSPPGQTMMAAQTTNQLRATWTPTPITDSNNTKVGVRQLSPTSTPIRIVVPAPTSTPNSPGEDGVPALLPEFGQAAEALLNDEASEAALSAEERANVRIDAMGPVPLATVNPLKLGDGFKPVRLQIPVLDLDTSVETMGWRQVQGNNGVRTEWAVVDFAAGHHINSAFPGEAGNVVLSGHNNIGGSVFRSVCVIGQPGVDFGLEDEMILTDEEGRRFTYRVNGWQRMKEANASIERRVKNAQWIEPTNHAQLTLVTCWPPSSNTHRVVVTGLLTDIALN